MCWWAYWLHKNTRTQGSPQNIVLQSRSLSFTSSVRGFNVVADGCKKNAEFTPLKIQSPEWTACFHHLSIKIFILIHLHLAWHTAWKYSFKLTVLSLSPHIFSFSVCSSSSCLHSATTQFLYFHSLPFFRLILPAPELYDVGWNESEELTFTFNCFHLSPFRTEALSRA